LLCCAREDELRTWDLTVKFDAASSIAIWGNGLEGRAAYKYFQDLGVSRLCYIVQEPPKDDSTAFILEADLERAITEKPFDLVVKSPGVSQYKRGVKTLLGKGIPVTSGTNLWFADNPGAKTIIVTGTKGKSTVSSIIHHLLTGSKFRSRLAGNIGRPLIGTPPGHDVTVLELSSYQTADLAFAADIAVITNLFEDHLDWHLGVKAYHADKLRVFSKGARTQTSAHSNPAGLTTPQVARLYDMPQHVAISSGEGYVFAPAGDIKKHGRLIATGFGLKGAHNQQNFVLAYDAACLLAQSETLDAVIDFSAFAQLPHRLEETYIGDDIRLVDDSISTIPEAAISAMDVYGDNTHVLIGGYDRQISYDKLITYFDTRRLKSISLFGPVGGRLMPQFKGGDHMVLYSETLSQALTTLTPLVASGDNIILSPAAPSFDEFKNFKDRGMFFIETMRSSLS